MSLSWMVVTVSSVEKYAPSPSALGLLPVISDWVACDMSALSNRVDCLVLHCDPSGRCLEYSLRGLDAAGLDGAF
eukprot:scaffold60996_cov84-Phaeocystis_antarctica.AAC.3